MNEQKVGDRDTQKKKRMKIQMMMFISMEKKQVQIETTSFTSPLFHQPCRQKQKRSKHQGRNVEEGQRDNMNTHSLKSHEGKYWVCFID